MNGRQPRRSFGKIINSYCQRKVIPFAFVPPPPDSTTRQPSPNSNMSTFPPNSLRSKLSKIGLGCGTFGREIDQARAFAMMDHALAKGVTHFDTAEAYGRPAGASERIIGAWLASRRPKPGAIFLATKWVPPYSAERAEVAVTESLHRLGLDSVDLYYFHGWDESVADPGFLSVRPRSDRSQRPDPR